MEILIKVFAGMLVVYALGEAVLVLIYTGGAVAMVAAALGVSEAAAGFDPLVVYGGLAGFHGLVALGLGLGAIAKLVAAILVWLGRGRWFALFAVWTSLVGVLTCYAAGPALLLVILGTVLLLHPAAREVFAPRP